MTQGLARLGSKGGRSGGSVNLAAANNIIVIHNSRRGGVFRVSQRPAVPYVLINGPFGRDL